MASKFAIDVVLPIGSELNQVVTGTWSLRMHFVADAIEFVGDPSDPDNIPPEELAAMISEELDAGRYRVQIESPSYWHEI